MPKKDKRPTRIYPDNRQTKVKPTTISADPTDKACQKTDKKING